MQETGNSETIIIKMQLTTTCFLLMLSTITFESIVTTNGLSLPRSQKKAQKTNEYNELDIEIVS